LAGVLFAAEACRNRAAGVLGKALPTAPDVGMAEIYRRTGLLVRRLECRP
jgi:hypothetical protein